MVGHQTTSKKKKSVKSKSKFEPLKQNYVLETKIKARIHLTSVLATSKAANGDVLDIYLK